MCEGLPRALAFSRRNAMELPAEFADDDVRFSDEFADYFIRRFSSPGEVVFDPFAGYGTTLYAAQRAGRVPLGLEIVPGRAAYIAANLKAEGGIIPGDALRLDALKLPQIDFSLTSPPYMQKVNHPEYPFAAYKITGQTYADYLSDIARIYKSLGARMRQGAYAVIEACNLEFDGVYTPLADDIARSVGRVLPLCGKIALKWTPARGDCYDHSIALVFRKGGA